MAREGYSLALVERLLARHLLRIDRGKDPGLGHTLRPHENLHRLDVCADLSLLLLAHRNRWACDMAQDPVAHLMRKMSVSDQFRKVEALKRKDHYPVAADDRSLAGR